MLISRFLFSFTLDKQKELAVGKSIDEMANSELIKLRFISQDSKEIVFKVKKTIKMGKIMARYSIQTVSDRRSFRLLPV